MPTTTNYGWTTPADTDLVKDGASAIRTLGSSIDATTKALNPSTTLGDIEYRSSTANTNTRLAIGTTGQVLTVSGGVPTWANAAGGGKLKQLISATTTTSTTITATTFTDTNLSATITPTSSTNKILVLGVLPVYYYRSGNYQGAGIRILRGTTNIMTSEPGEADYLEFSGPTITGLWHAAQIPFAYLDSPATTSATTYKLQTCCVANTNAGNVIANYHAVGQINLLEVEA